VRHADSADSRTLRRLVKSGHHPGAHRARSRSPARRWAAGRVSVWRGIALLLAGVCAVLVPLAAVTVTIGPPGIGESSYEPLWPLFGRTEQPPKLRPDATPTPGGLPPVPSGGPAGNGKPSDGPGAPTDPPVRPDPLLSITPAPTPSTAPAPPPLPPEGASPGAPSPLPPGVKPPGATPSPCVSERDKGKAVGLGVQIPTFTLPPHPTRKAK
jgi:hypothetical protein